MREKNKKVKNQLKNISKEDMQLVEPKVVKPKKYFYYGYYLRMITLISLFIIFILLSFIFVNKSILIQEEKNVFYEETGTPNYKVFLKSNDYYEDRYLEENMIYIASIIDYISVNYNYRFNSDTLLNGEYYYSIVADLEILNTENKALFFSKKYNLLEEKNLLLTIKKNILLMKILKLTMNIIIL